jgi:hypothetical protein
LEKAKSSVPDKSGQKIPKLKKANLKFQTTHLQMSKKPNLENGKSKDNSNYTRNAKLY